MKWRITGVALAALATSGCEHPFANAGMRGASPAGLVAPPATESEQAVIAGATLHALLGEQAASARGIAGLPAAGSAPPPPVAAGTWLEAQSVSLQALAERSRAAWLSVHTARNP